MRKLLIFCLIIIILATAIEVPDLDVGGISITGLFIGLATKVVQIARFVLKQILLAIANVL